MKTKEQLRLKSPLIVQLEVTPECNNKCPYCYNFWEYDESTLSRTTPAEEARVKELFDVLIEKEVPAACFTGGEPLMVSGLLFELLDRANEARLYTSINTNGRLINKQIAKRLKESGLNSILVSLHGDSQEVQEQAVGCPEAFSETVAGIENLVKADVNTTVNFVSTRKNVGRIEPTAEFLKSLGVRNMTVTPLLPFPGVKEHEKWAMEKEQFQQYFDGLISARNTGLWVDSTLPVAPCILRDIFPEDYQEYLAVLTPRVCMAGVSFMAVSPEGINRACIQAPELEEYGSDIKKNFEDSWQRAAKWSEMELLPKECRDDCYALPICGGGCRTSSLAINESTIGKTMYMGEPLTEEDALPFLQRVEIPIEAKGFRKRANIKLRKEDFGGVLANTSRQSFVVLDRNGVRAYRDMPDEFISDSRGARVLYAAGILSPSSEDNLPEYKQDISVVHVSELYPRLGGKLSLDKEVRMLRADTGERIYF